jgi:hypothetical protein
VEARREPPPQAGLPVCAIPDAQRHAMIRGLHALAILVATAVLVALAEKAERVHALENRGSHPDLSHRIVREKDMTNRNFVAFLMSSTSVENTPNVPGAAVRLPR